VELKYRRSAFEWTGLVLSFVLFPLGLIFYKHLTKLYIEHYTLLYKAAVVLFCSIVIVVTSASLLGKSRMYSDINKARRMIIQTEEDALRAEKLVRPWLNKLERYDNALIFDGLRIKAQCLKINGKYDEAEEILEALRLRYKHSRNIEYLDWI
jgi:hypothetical protein